MGLRRGIQRGRGIALIVVGAVASAMMRKVFAAKTEATERQ
jgi:hypothetical protein